MHLRSSLLFALCLLSIAALKPAEATYWLQETGAALSLSTCNSTTMPPLGSLNMWCPNTNPVTIVDLNPQVYFGTGISSFANFTWQPLGVTTPDSATFTLSGNFSSSTVPGVYNNIIHFEPSSYYGHLVLENFFCSISTSLTIRAHAAHVDLRNSVFETTDAIIFEQGLGSGADPMNYSINIDNLQMTYYNGVFLTRNTSQHPSINISNSRFELVPTPTSPLLPTSAPVFNNLQTFAYQSFSLNNVTLLGPTALPSIATALFEVIAQNVSISSCSFSDLASSPGRFTTQFISISQSQFYVSDSATQYGCQVCSGSTTSPYTNATGVSFVLVQNSTLPWTLPTGIIDTCNFYGVSFFTYDGDPAQMQRLEVHTSNILQRSSVFGNASDVTWLKDTSFGGPPSNFAVGQTAAPIVVAGNFFPDNIAFVFYGAYDISNCRLTSLPGATMTSGWVSLEALCVNGTLTVQTANLFINGNLFGLTGSVPTPSILVLSGGALQFNDGSSIYSTAIFADVGSVVSIFKTSVSGGPGNEITLYNTASMILSDELHVNFDVAFAGIVPGLEIHISPNKSLISLQKSNFVSGFNDSMALFEGTYMALAGNPEELVLNVTQTNCGSACQNGAICYDRLGTCTCAEPQIWGGPQCACSKVGLPSVGVCDPAGGQKWIVAGSWDVYDNDTLDVPAGYEFYIGGDCTNNGTIHLAPNTTMRLGGLFYNYGKLYVSSTLSTVNNLPGGRCAVTSNTIMQSQLFGFGDSSQVTLDFDATSIGDVLSCQQTDAPSLARSVFVGEAQEAQTEQLKRDVDALDSILTLNAANVTSSVAFQTSGSGNISGVITVKVKTTLTTNAKLTLAKSNAATSTTSTTLLLTTTTSNTASCASTDNNIPGTLSILISPCPTTRKNTQVKWYWYGIPIIVVGVIIIVAAIVVISVPKIKTKVLPYRGTSGGF